VLHLGTLDFCAHSIGKHIRDRSLEKSAQNYEKLTLHLSAKCPHSLSPLCPFGNTP